MSRSARELTARIARGDREAFTEFYHRWFDRLYAEARRITNRDESFCLDVVQDAMIRVIRSLRPVETERQLTAWLKTVVRAAAYDRLRGVLRRQQREASRHSADAVDYDDDGACEALRDRLRWLRRELASMDGSNARLLVMRYRLGWTLERIGAVLGIAAGAVDGRIRRAVAGLKERAKETSDE